jgi:very-short-patch-repair endonuclease
MKLIIEIDGSGHVNSESDRKRDKFFIQRGYRVLRFWNNEIDQNLEGVLNKIYQELNEK